MLTTLLIAVATFVCVATLAGGIMLLVKGEGRTAAEDRLAMMTSSNRQVGQTLGQSLIDGNGEPTLLERQLGRFIDVRRLIDQSGVKIAPAALISASLVAAAIVGVAWTLVGFFIVAAIPMAVMAASIPFLYLMLKRKQRLKKFGQQLPEALDLISRALRSGHSRPSGFHLVAEQIAEPLGPEFGRCYDEQNLGLPLAEALEELTERVPNVDLRFFATAVIIQRQTGGDLAEILDKIARLIRERFQIWGQIQALTGEGRLSGIVLMALPPVLFLVMLRINYEYVMKLFNDPLGQKMLAFAVVMQLIGAYAIRRIVNIKV